VEITLGPYVRTSKMARVKSWTETSPVQLSGRFPLSWWPGSTWHGEEMSSAGAGALGVMSKQHVSLPLKLIRLSFSGRRNVSPCHLISAVIKSRAGAVTNHGLSPLQVNFDDTGIPHNLKVQPGNQGSPPASVPAADSTFIVAGLREAATDSNFDGVPQYC
jgi:hypothetical protein